MKIFHTLMLLIALPFLILMGMVSVTLSSFSIIAVQIGKAWDKP